MRSSVSANPSLILTAWNLDSATSSSSARTISAFSAALSCVGKSSIRRRCHRRPAESSGQITCQTASGHFTVLNRATVNSRGEGVAQDSRLLDPLTQRHLDGAKRKAFVAGVEAIGSEPGYHVEVNVKYVLTTVGLIVLSHGDSVGGARFLERLGNSCHGRHQRTCKNALDVVDLGDVTHGNNEHVSMIP